MKITIPRFPQNPVYGQIHEGYTYIHGEWLKSYNDYQYQLIRSATKQGMKDYENEKELLKKAEKAHKETEELLEAINDVLDNHGDKLSLKTYSVLQKFILLYKPHNEK